MKRHLNTLFVTSEGAYLNKQGESVCVSIDGESRVRIPLVNLEGIVCFGRIGASPELFGACAEAGVSLSFLSVNGRFLASVVGFSPGNVLLRRAQYRAADSSTRTLLIARNIVLAKVTNARSVLLRGARDARDPDAAKVLRAAAQHLLPTMSKILQAQDPETVRGLEGSAARLYFDVFNSLLRKDSGFAMQGRTRRPPLDPVNALLSFVYSLVLHDVRSASEICGLDSAVGFLHRDRPGRPALALDLMEELRPFLADRLVLSLVNRNQVGLNEFLKGESGEYRMSESARKTVISSFQKRKDDEIFHPFINEKITIGMLPHVQARLLARHLRGDLDEYPPYLWK